MNQFSFRAVIGSSLVALVIAAASCGGGQATGSTCPQGSTLTYATFGQTFFKTNCLSCHSNSGSKQSPFFETVEQIRENKTKIDEEAAAGPNGVNEGMPDQGTVAEAERRKLGEWLACGAP